MKTIMASINSDLIRKRSIELLLLSLLAVIPVIGGCASMPEAGEAPVAEAVWDKQATEAGSRLLTALSSSCYAEFCKPLSAEMQAKLPEKEFDKLVAGIKAEAGVLQNYTFLTVLDQPLMRDYLWIVRFCRKVKQPDGRQEPVCRSRLFKLSLLKLRDRKEIASFGFVAM